MPLELAPFSTCIPRFEQPKLEPQNERKKGSEHKDARINELGRAIENDYASIRDKYGIYLTGN
jgi:hypothetical protein